MSTICCKMQSSWTKRAVEIDSPQPMSPDQLADPPDSTCAQVIHPKSEICSNKWLPTANKRNGKKQKENNGILLTAKFTEQGKPIYTTVLLTIFPLYLQMNQWENTWK